MHNPLGKQECNPSRVTPRRDGDSQPNLPAPFLWRGLARQRHTWRAFLHAGIFMRDPFKINGPTCISFSGGRTSAYMLWRVLQANGGLPDDAVVCFQNTGKEMLETLDFVHECSQRYGVPIVWLEWTGFEPPGRSRCLYQVVDRATAATRGEPFAALCRALAVLPNPVARTCTSYLKVKTMIAYLKGERGWDEWDVMLGLRADEPRRVARMRAPGRDN